MKVWRARPLVPARFAKSRSEFISRGSISSPLPEWSGPREKHALYLSPHHRRNSEHLFCVVAGRLWEQARPGKQQQFDFEFEPIDGRRRDAQCNGRDDERADDGEPGRAGGLRGRDSRHDEPVGNMESEPVDRVRVDLYERRVHAARHGGMARPGNDPRNEQADADGLRIDHGDACSTPFR